MPIDGFIFKSFYNCILQTMDKYICSISLWFLVSFVFCNELYGFCNKTSRNKSHQLKYNGGKTRCKNTNQTTTHLSNGSYFSRNYRKKHLWKEKFREKNQLSKLFSLDKTMVLFIYLDSDFWTIRRGLVFKGPVSNWRIVSCFSFSLTRSRRYFCFRISW